MGKKKFGDITTPGEAPEELLKIATGETYYIRIVNDVFYEWDEMWPTIETSKGLIRRRYVSDGDNGDNFSKLLEYKQQADIPKQHEGNWKLKKQYGCFIILGKPQKTKVNGKVKTKVVWDKENVHFWAFGIKVYRQLKNFEKDDELRETAEDKNIDMENTTVMEVFSMKLKKEKTGSEAWNVDYTLTIHKCQGPVKGVDTKELEEKIDEYTNPTKKSEIDNFVDNFGGGISEAESEDEEDDEEPQPKKKSSKNGKKKKPVIEDDDDEDDEVEIEEDEEESEDDEDDIDPEDDEDEEDDEEEEEPEDDEEEEEPVVKKSSKSKKKKGKKK